MADSDLVTEGQVNDLLAAMAAKVNALSSGGFLILGPSDPIPEGTAANTIIVRTVT